jgi:hypothetical protein
MITISADATYLKVGGKSIRKDNILFFDRDATNVHVILSGRQFGSMHDDNGITIPFAEADIAGHAAFVSTEELQLHLETR